MVCGLIVLNRANENLWEVLTVEKEENRIRSAFSNVYKNESGMQKHKCPSKKYCIFVYKNIEGYGISVCLFSQIIPGNFSIGSRNFIIVLLPNFLVLPGKVPRKIQLLLISDKNVIKINF